MWYSSLDVVVVYSVKWESLDYIPLEWIFFEWRLLCLFWRPCYKLKRCIIINSAVLMLMQMTSTEQTIHFYLVEIANFPLFVISNKFFMNVNLTIELKWIWAKWKRRVHKWKEDKFICDSKQRVLHETKTL